MSGADDADVPLSSRASQILISHPSSNLRAVEWTDDQIDTVERLSPKFELQILRLTKYKECELRIEGDDNLGIDPESLELFVDVLGSPGDWQENGVTRHVRISPTRSFKRLSGYCSAVWHFEVVPNRVLVSWDIDHHRNEDAGEIALRSTTGGTHTTLNGVRAGNTSGLFGSDGFLRPPLPPPPPPSSSTTHGTSSPRDRHPSLNSDPRSTWCWKLGGDHASREDSLPLANIALVLGRKAQLEREIKTVIWHWPKQTQAREKTSVSLLRDDGTDGLNKRRQREMEKIRQWFEEYLLGKGENGEGKKAEKSIRDGFNKVKQTSDIYQWIQELELELLGPATDSRQLDMMSPPRPQSRTHTNATSQSTHKPNEANFRAGKPDASVIGGLKGIVSYKSHVQKKFTEKMFDRAHSFITNRQTAVAKDFMLWRDGVIAEWERKLGEVLAPIQKGGRTTTTSEAGANGTT